MMTGAMLAASSGGVWSKGGTRPLPAGISSIFNLDDMICNAKETDLHTADQQIMHSVGALQLLTQTDADLTIPRSMHVSVYIWMHLSVGA